MSKLLLKYSFWKTKSGYKGGSSDTFSISSIQRSYNYTKCTIVHHCRNLYHYPFRRIIRQIRTNLEGFLVSRNRREKIVTMGAYHLTENVGNLGWKVNGKVTFRKFQPKIKEYVLRQSVHSVWYKPNGMLLTIKLTILGSFSVLDQR